MNRIHRARSAILQAGEIGVQKMLPCPVCNKTVTVGGPHDGQWIVQTHSPNDDPTVLCSGTDQRVATSPGG